MTKEHAIDWIKKSVNKDSRLWKAIESLVPELCESEDERIRKALIDGVRQIRCKNDITQEQMIVYLEKQKAKERLDRMAPIYNDKESFESALEKAWKYYNESASRKVDSFEDDYIECVFSKGFREGFLYKEKQKENPDREILIGKAKSEKQVVLLAESNGDENIYWDTKSEEDAVSLLEKGLKFFGKQKPAEWNEKDNIMFENIILCLKEYCLTDEIKWLKSLRPQPKQEWRRYIWAINLRFNYDGLVRYEDNGSYEIVTAGNKPKRQVNGEYILLKDISSVNWKPSEEQMEHLKRCFSHGKPHLPMPNQHVLESLYNDLEKL